MSMPVKIKFKEDTKDLFKTGNLVIHKDGTPIVIISSSCVTDRLRFNGIAINSNTNECMGFGTNYSANEFINFTGSVMFENK